MMHMHDQITHTIANNTNWNIPDHHRLDIRTNVSGKSMQVSAISYLHGFVSFVLASVTYSDGETSHEDPLQIHIQHSTVPMMHES
jgi:hypothetical protein